ncbi:hypothetical protein VL20_3831 [Microcystis panniformis FACHB-1757]|uniref:Uncharacterized protein n=1 Tax=Microcystis panniformis FACHB-1757 TaxID=1638788 RepID=A0A0K1S495_9CHRO|nr:hypothetical protein VL20_3831 [Microcystis panniformis FACHB-1757]
MPPYRTIPSPEEPKLIRLMTLKKALSRVLMKCFEKLHKNNEI